MSRRSLRIAAGPVLCAVLLPGCGEGWNVARHDLEDDDDRSMEREMMVETQLVARRITDPAVLAAARSVPRHLFVPDEVAHLAYEDRPLPIGYGQTISQPFVVAFMTEALRLEPDDKVLEVGTGSGYQAAVLAEIVGDVFTIEIVEELADRAAATLRSLEVHNVHVRAGDGYRGWPEEAPFDAIMVTAAPDHVPEPLMGQLRVGGRLVLPVGEFRQNLKLIVRTEDGYEEEDILPVRFVPMTGEAQGE